MSSRRPMSACLVLALAMSFTAGCLDFEEVLTVNPDGSGTVTWHYAIDKQVFEQMRQMMKMQMEAMGAGKKMKLPMNFEFNEKGIRKQFAKIPDVKIVSLKIEDVKDKDGFKVIRHVRMTFSFKQFSSLKKSPLAQQQPATLTVEEFKDGSKKFVYARAIGQDLAKMKIPNLGGRNPNMPQMPRIDKEQLEQMLMMLKPMFDGKKFKFKVVLPGELESTNSKNKTGNSAAWAYKVFDIIKQKSSMKATSRLGPKVMKTGEEKKEEGKRKEEKKGGDFH